MPVGRYHIIVDLVDVEPEVLTDEASLNGFLKHLPGVINMNILKGPEVIAGIETNPGLTGFVIIDFSHISIHTFSNSKQACVDIFSCKVFEQEHAIEEMLRFFKANRSQIKTKVVEWM